MLDLGQASGILWDVLFNIQFWLTMVLTSFITLIPVIVSRHSELLFSDNIINNVRHKRYERDYLKKTYAKKLSEMQKYSRSVAKFKKIYMQNADYEPDNLADKKMKDVVDYYKS